MTAFARTPGMGRIPAHPIYPSIYPSMPTPGAYGLAPASFIYEGKTNYQQAQPVKAGRTQATYFQREVHPTGERQLSGGAIVDALHGWQGAIYSANYDQD